MPDSGEGVICVRHSFAAEHRCEIVRFRGRDIRVVLSVDQYGRRKLRSDVMRGAILSQPVQSIWKCAAGHFLKPHALLSAVEVEH